ncbi:MAG: alpha-amylase family glycosyl hydrolase [Phycisphaerales bacterium]
MHRPLPTRVASLAAASLAAGLLAAAAPPTVPPAAPASAPAAPATDFPPRAPVARASGAQKQAKLPPSVRAERGADGRWTATFTLSAKDAGRAAKAQVAGDFTAWKAQAVAMQRRPDGSFVGTAKLADGTRLYKFILDDDRWIADPGNPDGEDDGHGGRNSILRLGTEASLDPSAARAGDGAIEGAALRHDPANARDHERMADAWLVRYRTLAGDVQSVQLCWKVPSATGAIPMRTLGRQGPFDVWEASLPVQGGAVVAYTFLVKDGSNTVRDPKVYSLDPAAKEGFRTPDWAKNAVWYQVMVDRFRNGRADNDPQRTFPWTHDWYQPAGDEGKDGQTFYKHFVFDRFGGGDLAGLRAKLPYLKELGVNALYLMPIFQATTPHKYNTTSYIHVDEHYGTRGDYAPAAAKEDLLRPETWTMTPSDQEFVDFLKEAKRMGFRVVVDGVFNHCGTGHPAFQDVKKNGQKSPYTDWFDIKSWEPFTYDAWWGFSELPVYKKDQEHGIASASLRRHIYDVTRRWMDPNGDGDPSDGIDGWRLDVPNEVPLAFWWEWRKFVKKINPDAYITGEIWDRAEPYLDGRAFDAVMNYEFAKPAIAWIGDREKKITASEFDRRLAALRLSYPAEAHYALMNLLDSHDTDRVASMLRNPDRAYNTLNREQEVTTYDASKPGPQERRRQMLLALLQMTYVGAPMIYYGDEVGMWGSSDPNNRKPMLWEDLGAPQNPQDVPDKELLAYYRAIIALRHAHPALRTGSFETVLVDDAQDTVVFLRRGGGEEVLVALNASGTPATLALPELGEGWTPVYGTPGIADDGLRKATVPAVGGMVWSRPAK